MKYTIDQQIKFLREAVNLLNEPKTQLQFGKEIIPMLRDINENLIAIRILRRFGDVAIDEVSKELDKEENQLFV